MTFEGFDAAPLIEAAGFSPDMPAMARAAFADDSGTLDAALREAARAERAATRAELFAADLWIGHSDARGLGASERPGLEAGTSWRALMPLLDDAVLELPGGKDGPLRAAYGEKEGGGEGEKEEEIVVKGSKPQTMDDGDALDGIPSGDNGIDSGGDLIGGSGIEAEETSNDCRDRQALEAKVEIRAEGDRDTHEHGVLIYRGADGQVHRSSLIQGTPESVAPDDVFQWLTDNGVSVSQVIGFLHNHPSWQYGRSDAEALINRYPSANDWSFAQRLVAAGAGGPDGDGFALYLMDTAGKVREFEYDDRAIYQGLTQTEKERDKDLPDETESDGSSCG